MFHWVLKFIHLTQMEAIYWLHNLWIIHDLRTKCQRYLASSTTEMRLLRWNWSLEEFVFEEREEPTYLEKNLSEQRWVPTKNSTDIRFRDNSSRLRPFTKVYVWHWPRIFCDLSCLLFFKPRVLKVTLSSHREVARVSLSRTLHWPGMTHFMAVHSTMEH